MKRKHLWGVTEGGSLTLEVFKSKKDAHEDIQLHKRLGIYEGNTKVVKLVISNAKRKRTKNKSPKKRIKKNNGKKSRITKRTRKV